MLIDVGSCDNIQMRNIKLLTDDENLGSYLFWGISSILAFWFTKVLIFGLQRNEKVLIMSKHKKNSVYDWQ